MNVERKFTALKDLKVSDEGPGTIEGYRSVFGVIDEGGDIVLKGAFASTLEEYKHLGFTAHSHDWTFKEAVGYPIDAYEDEHGWYVISQFHSTQNAQDVRTIAKERLKAGKQVGFSFGYAPKKYLQIEAKDYEAELPKYIKADLLPAMLKKAQEFNRIRVLKEVEAIEDSIVTAPMNKRAAATGVKSQGKGMLAEEMAQDDPSFWRVESAYCRLIRKIGESAKNAKILGNEFDWEARVDLASAELSTEAGAAAKQQIRDFLESSDDEFYLKGITGTESFESFEAAGTELKKFAQKMRSNYEIRLKEGRMLSASNRAKVQGCMDMIMELHGELSDLMVMSEPKPKEKEIDVDALRTQSLRLRSSALRTLAHV